MKYTPVTAVWEITFACNMRCKHCGSSCTNALPDELTEEEALKVCDEIGKLKLSYITLSGGEPLIRKDWHKIAKRLKENNVTPNMITNGWLLTQENVRMAKEAGISNIAISLDGLKETHDFMRKEGSFDRIVKSLDILKENKMPSSIITTVNNKNIHELPQLYELLKEKNVRNWQLQYAMPMGNFVENRDLIIEPHQIDDIIEFAHQTLNENKIRIDLADCVGFYNNDEIEVRTHTHETKEYLWTGCLAGKNVLGIRHNGNIVGCSSLRDDIFIEGNVRDRSLVDLWNDEKSFEWNRKLTKDQLTGFCANCQFGAYCLAGCSVLKYTIGKKLVENEYCSYKVAVDKEKCEINKIDDESILLEKGNLALEEEQYQLAEIYYSKLYETNKNKVEIINILGYIHYQLENYDTCTDLNKASLAIDKNNAYAHKGLGLSLVKKGAKAEGIENLEKAISLADDDFLDPYYDLALILYQDSEINKAKEILNQGRQKSEDFIETSKELYDLILEEEAGN